MTRIFLSYLKIWGQFDLLLPKYGIPEGHFSSIVVYQIDDKGCHIALISSQIDAKWGNSGAVNVSCVHTWTNVTRL